MKSSLVQAIEAVAASYLVRGQFESLCGKNWRFYPVDFWADGEGNGYGCDLHFVAIYPATGTFRAQVQVSVRQPLSK